MSEEITEKKEDNIDISEAVASSLPEAKESEEIEKENQTAVDNGDDKEPQGPQNEIQRFYEHFRKVPLKYLDIFIGVCAVALIAVVVVGYLKGHGYI